MRHALSGLRAWLVQRISAVYMLLFLVFLLGHLLLDPPGSHAAWRSWVLGPAVSVAVSLFFLVLLLHAWVGLRDVILDYAGAPAVRVGMLASLALALAGAGFWVLLILWPGQG